MVTALFHYALFAYLFHRFMTDASYYWAYEQELILWHWTLGIGVMVLFVAAQLIVMAAALRANR